MSWSPGLWPREGMRPAKSQAEAEVYKALRTGLPHGWTAWHSLRLRDGAARLGEGDFVFAIPNRGVLVLEVKGGQISQRDGRWFSYDKPLDRPPLEQALGFRSLLARRLAERGCQAPAAGAAVCFPDTEYERPPGEDMLAGVVLGRAEIRWLRDALPGLVERALPPAQDAVGPWAACIHDLWGESWVPSLSLGMRTKELGEDRYALTEAQLETLDGLAENDRVLVQGGAGSGKTLLAAEAARREVAAGRRVLLLCFTAPLRKWLASRLEDGGDAPRAPAGPNAVAGGHAPAAGQPAAAGQPGEAAPLAQSRGAIGTDTSQAILLEGTADRRLVVSTVSGLAYAIVRAAGDPLAAPAGGAHGARDGGVTAPSMTDTDYWRPILLRAGDLAQPRWDTIIVDEAQDLPEDAWLFLSSIVAPATRLWAFYDPGQGFWPDRKPPTALFERAARYRLARGRRCPPGIQALAERWVGLPHDDAAIRAAFADRTLAFVESPSATALHDKVGAEVDRLLSEGLTPGDIAIVSLRGQTAAGAIFNADRIGRHAFVRANADEMQEQLVADSFLRWKGLERPAVIVTDLPTDDEPKQFGVRMYVALTRARVCARIAGLASQAARYGSPDAGPEAGSSTAARG